MAKAAAYETGDVLTAKGGFPGGHYAEGEQVIVLEVGDDGVPIVGTAPHELNPVGRNMRLAPEYAQFFTRDGM
jgi:hypothetical protein